MVEDRNRVAFYTLGCKVNSYETESMWQLFKDSGYEKVDFNNTADVYLINTCTVTNTADKKSRQIIRRAIRKNPDAVIAVTGCYAQTSSAEVAAIPGVDIVIGTQGRDKLLHYVEQYKKERRPLNLVNNVMKQREFEELDTPCFSERTRALLKIQEGCNNFCTFCIIPWAKGLSRSRKPQSVLKQARQLVQAGYNEIVLTGIHTGGYGEDLENYTLVNLISDLNKLQGLKRIRISSIEASQVTEELIELLRNSPKVCKHLHIPLQAGDDIVLKNMRRKYTVDEYKATVMHLKSALPNVAITTDVIVGFPGETDQQFMNGYNFISELGFSQLHVFPYSKRNGTRAAIMPNQIPDDVKAGRVQKLLQLSSYLTQTYASKFIGSVIEVIPEHKYEANKKLYVGYSDNYIRCLFPATESDVGNVCKVRIDEVLGDYAIGTLLQHEYEEMAN